MRTRRALVIPLLAAAITLGGAAALAGPADAAAGSFHLDGPAKRPTRRPRPQNPPIARSPACRLPGLARPGRPERSRTRKPSTNRWPSTAPPPAGPGSPTRARRGSRLPCPRWMTSARATPGRSAPASAGGQGPSQPGQTLIEHWNGTRWSIVPSPNPAAGVPGDSDMLTSITGTGLNDLWAAGWDNNEANQTIQLLFEHWNGSTWTAATPPTPLRSAQIASGITAISPDNVWAVGSDQTGNSKNLAAHWNGTAWSIVPTPDITSAGDVQDLLTGVSGDHAGDVWASGYAHNVRNQNSCHAAVRAALDRHQMGHDRGPHPGAGTEGRLLLNGIQVLSPADAWAVPGRFPPARGTRGGTGRCPSAGVRW